jgi:hypothetical protein
MDISLMTIFSCSPAEGMGLEEITSRVRKRRTASLYFE